MRDEVRRQTGRGPIAVFLLLVGLVLGSAGGAGLGVETDGSSSQLRQTRTAKASLALRAAPREQASQEDDERDPLDLPRPARIVGDPAAAYPAAPPGGDEAALPKRTDYPGYRARAPPAA